MADKKLQGFNSTLAKMLGLDPDKVGSLSINLGADSTEVDARMYLDGNLVDVQLTYSVSDE